MRGQRRQTGNNEVGAGQFLCLDRAQGRESPFSGECAVAQDAAEGDVARVGRRIDKSHQDAVRVAVRVGEGNAIAGDARGLARMAEGACPPCDFVSAMRKFRREKRVALWAGALLLEVVERVAEPDVHVGVERLSWVAAACHENFDSTSFLPLVPISMSSGP